jgi:hypothetical protein
MKIYLTFDGMKYEPINRRIVNQQLKLSIDFNGMPISSYETFLNEARLSALSLSLYLASVLLSNPAPRAGAALPLKLLVLDDVLIGLDLSNRLPLLDILASHFADFQIILSTYDRVWYDIVHLQTLESKKWVYAELFSERIGDPGYEVPVLKSNSKLIQKAKAHFNAHDYRAAAVYIRADFEAKLKKFCSDNKLLVPYDKDPRRLTSEHFWNAVTGKRGGDGTCHVDTAIKGRIESLRKVALNPLNHAGSNNITKRELEEAIQTIENLTFN